MDGIHPPFEDKALEITLKTDDSNLDADTVINALDRTIEDLDTTLMLTKPYLMTQQQYQMIRKLKTQKQNQPWQQKQPLPD